MTQAYTLTVSKFNNIVRDIFNSEELLHNIQIVGEVFGVSNSKGSVYFTLKDEESSLPCVCFYGAAVMSGVKEGDMIVVTGSPNYYSKIGKFNFVVSKVEPFGLGQLFQKFQQLKEKLEKEGLFDQSHKKPIPKVVRRIGVVTSKDGAVIQDIKNVAWRRNRGVDIVLYDTKVQGSGAEREIAQGIEFFSEYDGIDVVIVARGGGSLEDLAAYNTELVARAAHACKKPLVSAVGHETDFSIVDFVSDLRAPTPSAAAELLTQDVKMSFAGLKKDVSRLSRLVDVYVANRTTEAASLRDKFLLRSEKILDGEKFNLNKMVARLSNRLASVVSQSEYDLNIKLAKLSKLNPLDILALGYAKIEQKGKSVPTAAQLDLDSSFEINFVDGRITAKGEKK
jgi:exodeoxyribonuclease VII large subunit